MRLNTPKASKIAGGTDGPSAEIVEQILGTAERKRARPASSLDVKVEYGSRLTTPPGKKKQARKLSSTKHTTTASRSGTTRARGGGGIPPPRKLELSDLEGMDEEQLLQALYEYPELAEVAAAAAAERAKTEGTKKGPDKKQKKPTSSPYYRTKEGKVKTVDEYPHHLRAMMEDGVPIKQWIILLVLLGAAFYQLRKIFGGPSANTTAFTSGAKKPAEKRKGGKQKLKKGAGNKQPKDVDSPGVIEKNTKSTVSPVKKDIAAAGTAQTPASPIKEAKVDPGSQTKKSPKKKKPKITSKADTNKSVPSPDLASTVDPSIDKAVVSKPELEVKAAAPQVRPVVMEHLNEDTNVNNDGWHTVSAAKQAEKQKVSGTQAVAPAIKSLTTSKNSVNDAAHLTVQENIVDEKGPAKPEGNVVTATPTAPAVSLKKKNPKVKKVREHENPQSPNTVEGPALTDDDEALAQMLQREEEHALMRDSSSTQEESWEEVTAKKKRSAIS